MRCEWRASLGGAFADVTIVLDVDVPVGVAAGVVEMLFAAEERPVGGVATGVWACTTSASQLSKSSKLTLVGAGLFFRVARVPRVGVARCVGESTAVTGFEIEGLAGSAVGGVVVVVEDGEGEGEGVGGETDETGAAVCADPTSRKSDCQSLISTVCCGADEASEENEGDESPLTVECESSESLRL